MSPYYWTHFRVGLSNSPQKFRPLICCGAFFFLSVGTCWKRGQVQSFLRPRLISQIVTQKRDVVISPICHLQLATPPKKKKTNLHFSIFKTLLATFFCFFFRAILRGIERYDKTAWRIFFSTVIPLPLQSFFFFCFSCVLKISPPQFDFLLSHFREGAFIFPCEWNSPKERLFLVFCYSMVLCNGESHSRVWD